MEKGCGSIELATLITNHSLGACSCPLSNNTTKPALTLIYFLQSKEIIIYFKSHFMKMSFLGCKKCDIPI